MKSTHLFLSAAICLTPLVAFAQTPTDMPPVTAGSSKTLEKVWKPGLRWIEQKPGMLERIDGTTITVKKEGEEYVVYENDERLQGLPSLKQARAYGERRVRHLVELKVLPAMVVDENAEEDAGVVKGVAPAGEAR